MSNVKASNEKGETSSSADDYEVFDQELLGEEFSDGYEEGYVDAAGAPQVSETIAAKNQDPIFIKREDTKSRLAIIYTTLTFLVFFTVMGIVVLDGLARKVSIIDNLEVVIPLISGVFLGTLGFVLGYYFRKGEEEKQ